MKFHLLDNRDRLDDVFSLIKEVFNIESKNICDLLNNQRILAMYDEDVLIGTVLISLLNHPIKCKKGFFLDYVSIKEEYRNKGLGTILMNKIIELAKEEKIDYIKLTSSSNKVVARKMYESLGMKIMDTDLFYYELSGGKNEDI